MCHFKVNLTTIIIITRYWITECWHLSRAHWLVTPRPGWVFFTSVTWEHWEIKLIFVFPHQVLRQGKDSSLTVPQLDRSSWRHACNVPCHKTSLPANCSGHAVIKISKSLNSVLNVRKIHRFGVNTRDLRLII